MGACGCKKKAPDECDEYIPCRTFTMPAEHELALKQSRILYTEKMMEEQIIEMLRIIGTYQDGEEHVPVPLVRLNRMADSEQGWCSVVAALVRAIPYSDALGPSAITIVFDDCPLPSPQTVQSFAESLQLSRERAISSYDSETSICRERNICIILGCIAEKFAGPSSVSVLSASAMDYLIAFVVEHRNASLALHALLAIEKFALTTENKWRICERLAGEPTHPLVALEPLAGSRDHPWREVGFCAKWALDNDFVVEGRSLSYQVTDTSNITAMMNCRDVSQYLKISADGLEARCDSYSFESARCTFKVDDGCWYYEVEIITAGVMQIGWATKDSAFQNHDGYGVGDDAFSLAYDGCRRLVWHKARAQPVRHAQPWRPGDTLGCLMDIAAEEAVFTLNGQRLLACSDIFNIESDGFYAAASFMAYQHCAFNFGLNEFKFPPQDRPFTAFNQFGALSDEEKKVVPRHVYIDELRNSPIDEGSCTVCYSAPGDTTVEPCLHRGFCGSCAHQLRECPLCRQGVHNVLPTAPRECPQAILVEGSPAVSPASPSAPHRPEHNQEPSSTDGTEPLTDTSPQSPPNRNPACARPGQPIIAMR